MHQQSYSGSCTGSTVVVDVFKGDARAWYKDLVSCGVVPIHLWI